MTKPDEITVAVLEFEDIGQVARLLPHLSPRLTGATDDGIRLAMGEENCRVFTAKVRTTVVGTLTVVVSWTPSGLKAVVHDVVVEPGSRHLGAARKLMDAAVAYARSRGATSLELTSHRSRNEAGRFYRRYGFASRPTVVYELAVPLHDD